MSSKRPATPDSRSAKRSRDSDFVLDASQNPDFSPTEGVADVGVIESVSMKNFMCHSRLDFNFCPNVNFITGHNGSGKSAVLTAVVVGLGGKASVTNRGNSAKQLIKSGKQVSEISIKLRNRGEEAYKPDAFGNSIIVERRLTLDGTSTYKLKNDKGAVISTRRDDLNHILDQFNIQVDNPVSILNQETSRSFLNSKNPSDKYKFFLKATQLEQMKHGYALADESRAVAVSILEEKEATLPVLQKEVREWEQKWRFHQSLDELRKKVNRLENELAWALTMEQEKILEDKQKNLNQEMLRTPKFKEKVDESEVKMERAMTHCQDIRDKVASSTEELQIIQPRYEEMRKTLNNQRGVIKNTKLELRKLTKEKEDTTRERNEISTRIKELCNTRNQENYDLECQELKKKLKTLEEVKEEEQAVFKTTDHHLSMLRSAFTKSKEDVRKLKDDEVYYKRRILQKEQQINELRNSRKNRLLKFGDYMPDLLKGIEMAHSQGKFHRKPVGPIGYCVKLKDMKWAPAVENCIRSLIFTFCCHDGSDSRQLEDIMRRVIPSGKQHPSIVVSKFQDKVHNVSSLAVQSNKYHSVLDELIIDNPVIANCLIDQRGIECILLIGDNAEARQVMRQNVPLHCRECFGPNGDQQFPEPNWKYYSNRFDRVIYLHDDVDKEINLFEVEIQNSLKEAENERRKIESAEKEICSIQEEVKKSEVLLLKIKERIRKVNYDINELTSTEIPAPVDVTALKEDEANYEKQLELLTVDHDNLNDKLMLMEEEEGDYTEKFNKLKESMNAMSGKAAPLEEELAHAENNVHICQSHKKHYIEKMKEHDKKIAEANAKVSEQAQVVEESVCKAEKICPRIKSRRIPQNIQNEIHQISKRLVAEEKTHGNKEEIMQKYFETKKKYEQIIADSNEVKSFLECLDQVVAQRKQAYDNFLQMISMRVRYIFVSMLCMRNYSGKMFFDHQKQQLNIMVQPSQNGELTKDMKALSGGERSFSTVSFILALWDAMESPFRMLDEFDVFMDMVNRRISMDMILDHTKSKRHHQFIFLTPQDMSRAMPSSTHVKIYRMPDPERIKGQEEENND